VPTYLVVLSAVLTVIYFRIQLSDTASGASPEKCSSKAAPETYPVCLHYFLRTIIFCVIVRAVKLQCDLNLNVLFIQRSNAVSFIAKAPQKHLQLYGAKQFVFYGLAADRQEDCFTKDYYYYYYFFLNFIF